MEQGVSRVSEGYEITDPKTYKSATNRPDAGRCGNGTQEEAPRKRQKLIHLDKSKNIVFRTSTGKHVQYPQFFRPLQKDLSGSRDRGKHMLCLRHTFATRLLEEGKNLKVVQELNGPRRHRYNGNIYSHVSQDVKRSAIDKLDSILP